MSMESADNPNEKRRFQRFQNYRKDDEPPSFLIDVSDISDSPLGPEDFSTGGFRVVLDHRPELGAHVPCAIKLEGVSLNDYKLKVAWVTESPGNPGKWDVGLDLEMSEEGRDEFASLLTAFLTTWAESET